MKKNNGRFKKGQAPWNKGKHPEYMQDENHHGWKGGMVGYRGLHYWIERRLGKPTHCMFEDETCKGMFEWANIDGEYKRDLNDYVPLCRSHHRRLDNKRRRDKK